MQLTQHAEGGLEGQESSASSLVGSLTRGWVETAAYRFRPWPSSGHPVRRAWPHSSCSRPRVLLTRPVLAQPWPRPCRARPSQTRTLPPPRPSAGAGSPAAYPVLQLRGELGLELAAGATAVVSLNEDLPGHRRLLRPHGEDRRGRAAGSGDTNHGHTPGLDPGLRPASPTDPPSAQSGPRPPGPTPSPMLAPRSSAPLPGPGPAPPTARFGPGNTNPPPLPSSCCRNAYASTYVLPQKASSPRSTYPPLCSNTYSVRPTLSGRKAILSRLRATLRGRAVGGARAGSAPRPARRSPAGRKRQGGLRGGSGAGPQARGRGCGPLQTELTRGYGPKAGISALCHFLLCHFLFCRADRVSNH